MKSDRRAAKSSLREEKEAVRAYKGRAAAAKDPDLKRVLRHNLSEEREHAAKLRPFAKEQDMKAKRKATPMMKREAKKEGESLKHEMGESKAEERREHMRGMVKTATKDRRKMR